MPRHKTISGAATQRRRAIAGAAARLMAEGGIADYGTAKRKAARQLGVGDDDVLPSNAEIEAELRAYQAIFHEEELHDRLLDLRRNALEVMTLLGVFHPCLTGAVLDGTAGRYAPIALDLFADSSKDVEIFLLSHDISYSSTEIRRQNPLSPETCLHFAWNDDQVDMMIYPVAAERALGRDLRASAATVMAMLTETSVAVPK